MVPESQDGSATHVVQCSHLLLSTPTCPHFACLPLHVPGHDPRRAEAGEPERQGVCRHLCHAPHPAAHLHVCVPTGGQAAHLWGHVLHVLRHGAACCLCVLLLFKGCLYCCLCAVFCAHPLLHDMCPGTCVGCCLCIAVFQGRCCQLASISWPRRCWCCCQAVRVSAPALAHCLCTLPCYLCFVHIRFPCVSCRHCFLPQTTRPRARHLRACTHAILPACLTD